MGGGGGGGSPGGSRQDSSKREGVALSLGKKEAYDLKGGAGAHSGDVKFKRNDCLF